MSTIESERVGGRAVGLAGGGQRQAGGAIEVDWEAVRGEFELSPEFVHLGASQFLASHPRCVRDAIERYRREVDRHPVGFLEDNQDDRLDEAREAAGRYGGVSADDVALTDSTTMGLGILYNGLVGGVLKPGDQILTTVHEYYSHSESIRYAAERSGADARRVRVYDDLRTASREEMVERLVGAVVRGGTRTRVVGVTWVHSGTGLKFPVGMLAEALADLNRGRDEKDRVLLCVDGVHGFAAEPESFAELGCDLLAAGCHKWLYGPRGTGVVYGRPEVWARMRPTIPSFTETLDRWSLGEPAPEVMTGREMSPGGFHTMEYRWALKEAFEFHERLGRENVTRRVHELNRLCKEGLAGMGHVTLHTPMEEELSAGIICFEVTGMDTWETRTRLREMGVVATASPYRPSYARFTPGIINSEEDVERGVEAVRRLG